MGRQLGAYELVCLLGEGGMGNIYVARHTGLGRVVAIKTLRPELANRKDNIARFFQEANTINALKHPNIVESLDLVEDVVDGAYCVLELLRGPDLKARLQDGPLSIESAIRVGTQLADALGKVHAIGVVHRDLKPENLILIERDGRDDFVKLIDFGIAQIGQQGAASVAGTAAYMAPEQAARGVTVDCRADIYSLGVILFEMVTGRHPFPSETDGAYLVANADTKVPRPSKLNPRCPQALEVVILRCMEKTPEARYASADHVAAALRMIRAQAARGGRAGAIAAGIVLAATLASAALLLVPTYLDNGNASAAPAVETAAAPAPTPPPPPGPTPTLALPPAATPTVETAKIEPAPQQPPAETATVDIGVVTLPAGVTVYRMGETVALGVTPFTVALPRSAKPLEMRFERSGYQSKTVEIPVDASLEIAVDLARKSEPAAATRSVKVRKRPPATDVVREQPQPKKVQREGVMDPFANP